MQSKLSISLLGILTICSTIVWIYGLSSYGKPLMLAVHIFDVSGEWRFVFLLLFLLLLVWKDIRTLFRRSPRSNTQRESPHQVEITESNSSATLFVGVLAVTIFLAGVFAVRAFLKVPTNSDEANWAYVANAWLRFGLPPYVGTLENKTPGIFYLFYVSNFLFGVDSWFPRFLGVIASTATTVGLYAITKRLHSHYAGLVVMIIYGLVTTSDFMSGKSPAQTETFMLVFTVFAAYLLLVAPNVATQRRYCWSLLGVGVLLGCAITFKQIAVFSALGLGCLYLAVKNPYRRIGRDIPLVVGGIALAIAGSMLPLLMSGVSVMDYLHGAWLILCQPGSSAMSLAKRWSNLQGLFDSPDLQLFLPILLLLVLFRRWVVLAGMPLLGIVGWFGFEFLGANASGIYVGHQLRQFLPPLALLTGVTLTVLIGRRYELKRLMPRYQLLIGILLVTIWWPVWKYDPFPGRNALYRETASWIRFRTSPSDYIYIFSVNDGNPILAFSERRASSRHFMQYFLNGNKGENELKHDLRVHPPTYLLLPLDNRISLLPTRPLPEWVQQLAQEDYHLEKTVSYMVETSMGIGKSKGFYLYRRNGT